MQLYYHPISPYARKVLFALYEKALRFDATVIQPGPWQRQSEAMNHVSTLGMTPVLVTDDHTVLTESSIIIEHLDLLGSSPRFVPSDPSAALQVRMLDRIIDSYLITPAGQLYFENKKPAAAQSASKKAAMAARAQNTLSYLEQRLTPAAYLSGEHPQLADLGGCAAVAILDGLGFALSDFPRVNAWYRALSERPAWKQILRETDTTGSPQ
jgi:glutathione S-transferase